MHDTAYEIGQKFLETHWTQGFGKILDVGARDVNGTLRVFCPPGAEYVGVDLVPGPGVDIVLDGSDSFPFEDESFDIVLSSSCFEHDQMFWLTFAEMARVLKPGGYIFINAPSNGTYHSYPYDNWRFYPDSGLALEAWAARLNIRVKLRESFVARRKTECWNDFVMVFGKTGGDLRPPQRCLSNDFPDAFNIRRSANESIGNFSELPEDMLLLEEGRNEIGHLSGMLETTRGALAERDAKIEDLGLALAARDAKIADRDLAVAARNERIENITQVVAARDFLIAGFINSRSWRVTRPLRRLAGRYRFILKSAKSFLSKGGAKGVKSLLIVFRSGGTAS